MTFKERHIHFVGIGGIGMSGIARMLLAEGKTVSGSDLAESPVTRALASAGADVKVPQSAGNVAEGTDLVVISAAIKPDNVEVLEATRRGVPVQKYAEVLGRLMNARRGIAVSGTHGKTTTTAMIATVLQHAGLDPSFVVGAAVGPLGGSSGVGAGEHFVVEACEYDRSFHHLRPHCAVINNVEEDHLDYYTGGLDEIVASFGVFASQVRPEGLLVANHGDANVARAVAAAETACRVETFGLEDAEADWSETALRPSRGVFQFDVRCGAEDLGTFELGIPGRHNVSNALAALACCRWAGVDARAARAALRTFRGAERRFQIVGEAGGVTVVDDYAHHPSEIRETLWAARGFFPGRRLLVVFQPHQHSRTRFLLADFAASFDDADAVWVPEIYFVRDSESERQQVTSSDLVDAMKAHGKTCHDLASFDAIVAHLGAALRPGDVVITMGAGDVNRIGGILLADLTKPGSQEKA